MYKLKEWFCWFFLIGAYVWGCCSIIACFFIPLILSICVSLWWLLAWLITVPAAITILIIMDTGKKDKQK